MLGIPTVHLWLLIIIHELSCLLKAYWIVCPWACAFHRFLWLGAGALCQVRCRTSSAPWPVLPSWHVGVVGVRVLVVLIVIVLFPNLNNPRRFRRETSTFDQAQDVKPNADMKRCEKRAATKKRCQEIAVLRAGTRTDVSWHAAELSWESGHWE